MAASLKATFFALRRRGKRGVLLRATLVYLLLSFLIMGIGLAGFLWSFGYDPPALAALAEGRGPEPTPPPSPTLNMLWLFPLTLIVMFVYCVLTAAYEAACLRWMIRGETGDWFGEDALHVYFVYWAWFGFWVVWGLAYLIVQALLDRLGAGDIGSIVGAALLGVCALLSAVAFAPAAAVSVAGGRFAFLEATEVSEEHLFSLLGSFALLLGGQWVLANAATIGWWTWALGPDWLDHFVQARDYSSLLQAQVETSAAATRELSALGWAVSAFSFVSSIVVAVLVYGVNARAAQAGLEEGRIKRAT